MKKLLMVSVLALAVSNALADVETMKIGNVQFVSLPSLMLELNGTMEDRPTDTRSWKVVLNGQIAVLTEASNIAVSSGKKIKLLAPVYFDAKAFEVYAPLENMASLFKFKASTVLAKSVPVKVAPDPVAAPVQVVSVPAVPVPPAPIVTPAQKPTKIVPPPVPPTPAYEFLKSTTPYGDDSLIRRSIFHGKESGLPSIANAISRCRNIVKIQLKSPASASFDADGVPYVHSYPDGVLGVLGDVDAQNSYGALLRSRYYCWMKMIDGEVYMYGSSG